MGHFCFVVATDYQSPISGLFHVTILALGRKDMCMYLRYGKKTGALTPFRMKFEVMRVVRAKACCALLRPSMAGHRAFVTLGAPLRKKP